MNTSVFSQKVLMKASEIVTYLNVDDGNEDYNTIKDIIYSNLPRAVAGIKTPVTTSTPTRTDRAYQRLDD